MNDQQLEAKYNQLVRDYRLLQDMMHEAESQMVEEISAEGFASQETRKKVSDLGDQVADADFDLYCFKQDNKAFVADLKEKRAKAREEDMAGAIERLWNN